MVKTLELAISKAASLPEAAQEQLGRELLVRIEDRLLFDIDRPPSGSVIGPS